MQGGEIFFVLLLYLVFAFLIAHFLGRKRKIGFGWSFFFSIFPNPIVGLIITLLSRKTFEDN
jgi:uncharacterized membrane protein